MCSSARVVSIAATCIVTAGCVVQVPRLYHLSVALPHFKKWQAPDSFTALHAYLDKVRQHPAFKATDYGENMIIKGWVSHGIPERP